MPGPFQALADPTRRGLLERLRREGALSLSELADPLPMSRQAVTKHLDILQGAGLVAMRTEGRERVHELRAGPLVEVRDWLAPYEKAWDQRLQRLDEHPDSE